MRVDPRRFPLVALFALAASTLVMAGADPTRSPAASAAIGTQVESIPGDFHFVLGPEEPVIDMPPRLSGYNFPDDHISFLKYPDGSFRVWTSLGAGGIAVVLHGDEELQVLTRPVVHPILGPPGPGTAGAFDHNYAAPGQVFIDPLDPTKLYMIYEAETLCFDDPPVCKPLGAPGSTYVSVGMARATDLSGDGYPVTWTGFPDDSRTNEFGRTVVLESPDGKPVHVPGKNGYYGDGIPSGFVDPKTGYFYAFYTYHANFETPHKVGDNRLEVARASFTSIRSGKPDFHKWNEVTQEYDIPWNGHGSAILPPATDPPACLGQNHPSVSYNVALKRYLLVVLCGRNWFYSTATSMKTQDWTTPRFLSTPDASCRLPCIEWYPSPVSLDQPSGSTTSDDGFIYYLHGKALWRRTFAIVPGPPPPPD